MESSVRRLHRAGLLQPVHAGVGRPRGRCQDSKKHQASSLLMRGNTLPQTSRGFGQDASTVYLPKPKPRCMPYADLLKQVNQTGL